MRPDHRPPVLVSTLMPGDFSFDGERRFVVCGGCHTWRRVRRGRLWPHHTADGAPCPQSRRRVWFDLTPAQQQRARRELRAATSQAESRRPPRPGQPLHLTRPVRLTDRDQPEPGAAGRPGWQ